MIEQENRALAGRVQALETQLGREDGRIADLENQVFLMTDQLRQARVDAPKMPELRLVHLAPESAPAAAAAADDIVDIELEGDEEPRLPRAARGEKVPGTVSEADDLFREALTVFREGKAQAASQLFERFVQRFPRHTNADKALYWMGEARYESGAFAQAVTDLEKLLTRYPRSGKVPDALLKVALAYERLGNAAKAREALEDLVRNYPSSPLGELARARLTGDTGGTR